MFFYMVDVVHKKLNPPKKINEHNNATFFLPILYGILHVSFCIVTDCISKFKKKLKYTKNNFWNFYDYFFIFAWFIRPSLSDSYIT
jgi:hypothetical protein